jgi:DNA (cytosine-5)-methyltransferase 1
MGTLTFVDLFAGCGGFSLGLSMAGLKGRFAVERDPMAFATFEANLSSDQCLQVTQFDWPKWLPKRAWDIEHLLSQHKADLEGLRGSVDVLAGGPPCQGFSFAGRRKADDPRNMLFAKYVEVVEAIQPRILLLENVPGMLVAHGTKAARLEGEAAAVAIKGSYFDKLANLLRAANYSVDARILDASTFGVPQKRLRLIVVGIRNDCAALLQGGMKRAFDLIGVEREKLLAELGLGEETSARDALSDLETAGGNMVTNHDSLARGTFSEMRYVGPKTRYQRRMRDPFPPVEMNSMRLARHSDAVSNRFGRIIAECAQGIRMSGEDRARFGLKKHRIVPIHPNEPAPTITTLPEDLLHYSEPRILTVRECARLQSFPDWFQFRGKYTTGGHRRILECPRYTQVGNAVPPLLARGLGKGMLTLLAEVDEALERNALIDDLAVA